LGITDKAGQFVTQQIDRKLIDPKLNEAVENLVATQIKPLEERVEHLNKDIQAKQVSWRRPKLNSDKH
jgi:hypothetical protein